MRRSLAKFSESEASNHTPFLADFTTTTLELKFSVHTGPDGLPLDAIRCPQTPFPATMAECRSTLASGSYQGIVADDDKDRYRGVIMPADLFSGLIDSPSNGASIISLARHSDTLLRSNMNVKAAMEHFDRAEAELLAVVSDDAHLKVVGDLTVSYARRRYAEELDQATQGTV
jgi:chloride channel protein, CIC family